MPSQSGNAGSTRGRSVAEALEAGDRAAIARVAAGPIKPLANNFVERPWGGMRIRAYKGLCPLPDQQRLTGFGLGEAFELAACPSDPEGREHPSLVVLEDGSRIHLPRLLALAGPDILGERFVEAHGRELPLLPKTLDIQELLSVQGHPEGNTELYVIIDAEEGASIRLGFREPVDPASLVRELEAGRERQHALLSALREDVDQAAFQARLGTGFANRKSRGAELLTAIDEFLRPGAGAAVRPHLEALRALYWKVLDLLNEIPVRPGQVIYNANPARITRASGGQPSAEVHALGNPEGREILMLEIRRPGPTFRAWDNVRFPLREIDADKALAALNLQPTGPEEFEVTPRALTGQAGVLRAVQSAAFVVELCRPAPDAPVACAGSEVHTLHCIRGGCTLSSSERRLAALARGESALMPAGVGGYTITSSEPDTEVVRVTIPLPPP